MIEPTANEETAPDFEGLLVDVRALADFIIDARASGDERHHLAVAHANLMDAWTSIYKHKAGLP